MPSVRSLLRRRPLLAAMLVVLALAMRLLVPAGYMPVAQGGALALQLCPGTMPAAAPVATHMAGMHHGSGKGDPPAKAEQPCAYAALSAPALGGADPAILAAAVAFALLLAGRAMRSVPPLVPARLRPPLRAPPVRA